jgi:hypothetical protein
MLSAFQLVGKKRCIAINITSDELKELAQEIARQMAKIGRKYEKRGATMNRESLLITIYSETLNEVTTEEKWKGFFTNILETIPA